MYKKKAYGYRPFFYLKMMVISFERVEIFAKKYCCILFNRNFERIFINWEEANVFFHPE